MKRRKVKRKYRVNWYFVGTLLVCIVLWWAISEGVTHFVRWIMSLRGA